MLRADLKSSGERSSLGAELRSHLNYDQKLYRSLGVCTVWRLSTEDAPSSLPCTLPFCVVFAGDA